MPELRRDRKRQGRAGGREQLERPLFSAVRDLWQRIISLGAADVIILSRGLAGAITAGIVIKLLRKNGYPMF